MRMMAREAVNRQTQAQGTGHGERLQRVDRRSASERLNIAPREAFERRHGRFQRSTSDPLAGFLSTRCHYKQTLQRSVPTRQA